MIDVRAARMDDAQALAPRLRAEDDAECVAAGMSGLRALEVAIGISHQAWVALEGERVIAAWGFGADNLFGEAEVWLLTAPAVECHKRVFVTLNIEFLEHVLRLHGSAVCHVHAPYTRAVRWLAWLGFERVATITLNGAEFYQMKISRVKG